MSQPNDDIDLLNLLERSLRFFQRYRWWLIGMAVMGLLAGLVLYLTIARTYDSKMLVHSNVLTNQEEIQVVRNWNSLLGKGEHETLSRMLNMDRATLGKVSRLGAEEIQQVFSPVNPHGFTISATVTDTAVLDKLQAGIIYGFENSPFVREKLAFNREALEVLIDKTELEIAQLDSMKNSMGDIISGRGRASSSVIMDGGNLSREIIALNEKLIGLKRDLQFTSAVQVLQGFQKFSRPSDPNLLPLLALGLLVFLAIAYALALVHSLNRKLKQRKGGLVRA